MANKKVKKIKKVTSKNTKKVVVKPTKKATKAVKNDTSKDVEKNIEEVEEVDIEIDEVAGGKGKVKKPLEVDAADILPEVEEKVVEEDVAILGTEDEESEEGLSLDSEDVNPFGDKWEM